MSSGVGQALMASSNNTLLRVLDGLLCRLDTKYGRLLNKKRHVPVVTRKNDPVHS